MKNAKREKTKDLIAPNAERGTLFKNANNESVRFTHFVVPGFESVCKL